MTGLGQIPAVLRVTIAALHMRVAGAPLHPTVQYVWAPAETNASRTPASTNFASNAF